MKSYCNAGNITSLLQGINPVLNLLQVYVDLKTVIVSWQKILILEIWIKLNNYYCLTLTKKI